MGLYPPVDLQNLHLDLSTSQQCTSYCLNDNFGMWMYISGPFG